MIKPYRANPLITDKNLSIPSRDLRPHYSDPRFWRDHLKLTVFLAPGVEPVDRDTFENVPNLNYIDSYQLPLTEYADAWDHAETATGATDNVLFYEHLLARLFDREVEISHLITGVDVAGTGNPYHIYGTTP